MTVHHDKLAYGKLASMREDFSEDSLIQMARFLSEKKESAISADKKDAPADETAEKTNPHGQEI